MLPILSAIRRFPASRKRIGVSHARPEEARQHAYLFVAMLAHALSRLGHDVTDVVVDE